MQTIKELAFIDPNILDLNGLLAGLRPEVEPVLLSPDESVPAQIGRAILAHVDLNAIHIIAHGQAGEVRLAAGALSAECINDFAEALAAVGRVLRPGGELLLWCCNTGHDLHCESFIAALERATGTATGLIGVAAKRGAWALELIPGAVKARPPLSSTAVQEHRSAIAAA
jgi:hypothetical protein